MKWTFLAVLALAGCANNLANEKAAMDGGLHRLMGQDIHAAIDALGYPTSQAEIAGDTVYDWYSLQNGTVYAPNNSYQVGASGALRTTYSGAYVPAQWTCKVRLAERGGRVIHYEYNGDGRGCALFAGRLSAWMRRG